jgi:hypothetical protein
MGIKLIINQYLILKVYDLILRVPVLILRVLDCIVTISFGVYLVLWLL